MNPKIDYDSKFDTLYYTMSMTDNSYGDEINSNIVILRDMDSDEVTGVTIIGFKKYFKNDEIQVNKLSKIININSIIDLQL